jgi:hypothetical protein
MRCCRSNQDEASLIDPGQWLHKCQDYQIVVSWLHLEAGLREEVVIVVGHNQSHSVTVFGLYYGVVGIESTLLDHEPSVLFGPLC